MASKEFPPLDLGPIAALVGRWRGRGKDVAFLPGGIRIEADYIEDMTVSAAPVMRLTQTMFVHAAAYETRLVDATTGEPLHHESGYWAWCPESSKALRIIALGRALGVVAASDFAPPAAGAPIELSFSASRQSDPCGIATFALGPAVPVMEELLCGVRITGNSFSYDQITRVRFGPSAPLDHTDQATLHRQP